MQFTIESRLLIYMFTTVQARRFTLYVEHPINCFELHTTQDCRVHNVRRPLHPCLTEDSR